MKAVYCSFTAMSTTKLSSNNEVSSMNSCRIRRIGFHIIMVVILITDCNTLFVLVHCILGAPSVAIKVDQNISH